MFYFLKCEIYFLLIYCLSSKLHHLLGVPEFTPNFNNLKKELEELHMVLSSEIDEHMNDIIDETKGLDIYEG